MSNAASAAITVTVRHTPISYRRLGTVIADELPEPARAVDPRGLVKGRVDLGHAGQQQDGAEPQQNPDPDEADGRERPVEVAEPGTGERAEADGLEDLVDQARAATAASPR